MENVITIPALGDNYIYLYRYDPNNAFVIEPGEASSVLKILQEQHLRLVAILVTHRHFDHTAGIQELTKKTGCKIAVAKKNQIPLIADMNVQVLATPGHTQDSLCYYLQPSKNRSGVLFTGDTLFTEGMGRTDLPGASMKQIMDSIRNKILTLPDDTVIWPGHHYGRYPTSTVREQKRYYR